MSRQVRGTLAALLTGSAAQRLLQFAAAGMLARQLGIDGLGEFMVGVQAAAMMSLLVDGGIRTVVAREIAADPDGAGGWLRASLRLRAVLAVGGFTVWAAAAAALAADPWFWLLCGSTAPLALFDLKAIADARGQAAREVAFEAAATCTFVGGTALLACFGCTAPAGFAGALVAGRLTYAVLAAGALRVWCRGGPRIRGARLWQASSSLGVSQLANELLFGADVVLLRLMLGAEAAGLFAAAQRIALAAETPVRLVLRLVQPHLARACAVGDPVATLARAVRASGFAVLPVAAGGLVVADALVVALYGPSFAAAAAPLRWLLLGSVILGVGSCYGHQLVARRDQLPYLLCLWAGAGTNLALTVLWIPAHGPGGAAAATAAGAAVGCGGALVAVQSRHRGPLLTPLLPPLWCAGLVAAAAWSVPPAAGVAWQVAAGALVLALLVARLEFRGRWRSWGEGLERGSGFRSRPELADSKAAVEARS